MSRRLPGRLSPAPAARIGIPDAPAPPRPGPSQLCHLPTPARLRSGRHRHPARLPHPATVRALCQVAAAHGLIIICEITERIAASRSLYATIVCAVAGVCTAAGLAVLPPQAAFYLYRDFEPGRDPLRARHQVSTGPGLARLLLDRSGAGTLPATAFGEHPARCGLDRTCPDQGDGSGREQRHRWPGNVALTLIVNVNTGTLVLTGRRLRFAAARGLLREPMRSGMVGCPGQADRVRVVPADGERS